MELVVEVVKQVMRYYIADLHFFHEKLNTKMDCRGFASMDEMHAYMIDRWNKKVRPGDEVVIIGDLSFGDANQTNEVLDRLHGKLFLITGNHDHVIKHRLFRTDRFEWIKPYEELNDNNRKVVLCHYPIMCYNGQYRVDKEGNPKSYMLYGHVHDTMDQRLLEQFQETTRKTKTITASGEERLIPCNMINCFCMYSDYEPLSLDEWIELDKRRREKNCT